jgi:5'(3')-deoxyribonucleotidase
MRVGVDADGVMYDFDTASQEMLVATGRYTVEQLPIPPKRWNLEVEWGIDSDEFFALCNASVDAGVLFRTGEPYPDVADVIRTLREEGDSIHIITNRFFGSKSIQNTVEWLADNKIEYDSIHFCRHKHLISVDVLLDDYERHYHEGLANGQRVVLMDRLHNAHLADAERVTDWKAFLDFCRGERERFEGEVAQNKYAARA